MQDCSDYQFDYGGKRYEFSAVLYSSDKPDLKANLQNQFITRFEYSNILNGLCLEGSIIYEDHYGTVDQFRDVQLPNCNIYFCEVEQEMDGDITISKNSDTSVFSHQFLVNSIKIIKRAGVVVTYSISLISTNWFKCIGNIAYSNYDKAEEPIFGILKNLLVGAGLQVDKETFDSNLSEVKLKYITNGNDNLFTSQKYLMNKLFYYPTKDDVIRFLVYNETKDTFQVLNLKDQSTVFGASEIVISMFKNDAENMTTAEPNNMGGITKMPKTEVIKMLAKHQIYDFDLTTNQISNKTFDTKSILQYGNASYEIEGTESKYVDFSGTNAFSNGSYWNNSFDTYGEFVKTLLGDSSLVIETDGQILRKPGYYANINLDRDTKLIEDDDPEKMKEIKNKYRAFEGTWVIGKVRHLVFPSVLELGKKKYRQNLVLFRNFNISEKDADSGEAPSVG